MTYATHKALLLRSCMHTWQEAQGIMANTRDEVGLLWACLMSAQRLLFPFLCDHRVEGMAALLR